MKKASKPTISNKEQIKAMSTVSSVITSDLLIDDALKMIVTVITNIMKSNICSIHLIDEKTNSLIIKATQSISDEYNKKPPLKIGEGIAGKVAKENKPISIKNISHEKEYIYHDIAKKENLVSLLSVPMSIKGKVLGVINSYYSTLHDYTEKEIDLLTSIANIAALAIENSKLVIQLNCLKEEIETRKVLDRAKGILMRDDMITEEKAYLKIQRFAMDKRKTIREISEAIIIGSDIKN